jgi:AcrR family transcriptional regulator
LPKIVDHDARRADILRRCFSLFAERGYSSLSMREIAQTLDVSTGTLYHYFDGKRSLFERMFDWVAAQDAEAAKVEVPADVAREIRGHLLRLFLLARAEHLTKVIKLAVDFQRQHSAQEAQEAFRGLLSSYIGAIMSQMGALDEERARLILSMIIGALLHHSFDPERAPLEPQLERVTEMCLTCGLF